jgi:hypothetical protein
MVLIYDHPRSTTVIFLDESEMPFIMQSVSTLWEEPILRLWRLYYESFQNEP